MTVSLSDIQHDAEKDQLVFVLRGQAKDFSKLGKFFDRVTGFRTDISRDFANPGIKIIVDNVSAYNNPEHDGIDLTPVGSAVKTFISSIKLGIDTSLPPPDMTKPMPPGETFDVRLDFLNLNSALETDASGNLAPTITIDASKLGAGEVRNELLNFAGFDGSGALFFDNRDYPYQMDVSQLVAGKIVYRGKRPFAANDQNEADEFVRRHASIVANKIGGADAAALGQS